MIHIPIAIVAGAVFRATYKHMQDKERQRKDSLMSSEPWIGTIRVPRRKREVRISIGEYLDSRGFRYHDKQNGITSYCRGDLGISRLPWKRDVSWPEIPVLLVVIYKAIKGEVLVTISIAGWPTTSFSKSVEQFFREHAEMEFDGAIEFLNGGEEPPQSESPKQPSQENGPRDDDLVLLGVTENYTQEQLQTAYRTACRKYHPDRLVGVEPDVVKLAEQHFTRVSAAYQRLRKRTPQAC